MIAGIASVVGTFGVSLTSNGVPARADDFLVARLRAPFGSGAIRSNPFHVPQLLVLRLGLSLLSQGRYSHKILFEPCRKNLASDAI